MINLIKKSFGAALCISIGVYGLLVTNYSILSMLLFTFGLFTICSYNFYLFTGKCGYTLENLKIVEICMILLSNLVFGYLFGLLFSINPELYIMARIKIVPWEFSLVYFIKSVLCGCIMFVAVDIFKNYRSPLAIFIGVPLFIMCGFQHSIANVIIMGCARTFNPAIILAILGNWIGALGVWFIRKD